MVCVVFLNADFAYAAGKDNGTDANGKMIISKKIAMRCGIGSGDKITEDCLKRLAYDYKTNKGSQVLGYKDWNDLRKQILNDYTQEHLPTGVKELIKSGEYKDRINELLGRGSAAGATQNNDIRQLIDHNTELVADHNARLLDLTNMRAAVVAEENINYLLTHVVPEMDVDPEKDTDLATPPKQ